MYNNLFPYQQAEEFLNSLEGPSSFYGLQDTTLHSLILMMLPSHKIYHKHQGIQCTVNYSDESNLPLSLLETLLHALRYNMNFWIPQVSSFMHM